MRTESRRQIRERPAGQGPIPSPETAVRPGRGGTATPVLGWTLFRYSLAEILAPTLVALASLVAAALIKDLLGYADLVVNRGLGARAVGTIALRNTVPIATAMLPFAGLIGALVGLGRLRADRELDAMAGAGLDPLGLLRPVLTLALAASALGLGLSLWAAPAARRGLEEDLRRMATQHPGALLRAGAVHEFGQWQLVAREVSPSGARLRGVLLWIPDLGETLFAERAEVEARGVGRIDLTLHDALALTSPRSGAREIRLERFHAELAESSDLLGSTEQDPLRATPLRDLLQQAYASGADAAAAREALAHLHERFALPLSGLALALMALPLALGGSRLSRSGGAVIGLLVVVGYYGLTQLANGLLRWEGVPVALAAWLPNAVALVVACALLLRARAASSRPPRGAMAALRAVRDAALPGFTAPKPRAHAFALDRYVLSVYLRNSLLCFTALLTGYLVIDVLERMQWFARHHADASELLRFYAARLPLLASRIVPLSLLAGSALTLSTLSSHGELVAMQACGIRLGRGLAAILLASLVLAPADFALNDALVPRTNALADRIKREEIKQSTADGKAATTIWYRTGELLLRAPQLALELGSVRDVTIYELGPNGIPTGRIDARSAQHLGRGAWRLDDARRVVISERGLEEAPAPEVAQLGVASAAARDPMHMSVRELRREIRLAERSEYSSTPFRVDLQRRFAEPVGCALLPALAILQGLGARRRASTSRSLLASGILGVGYVLLADVAATLGYGEQIPAALAGWGAPALAGLIVAVMAWRRGA